MPFRAMRNGFYFNSFTLVSARDALAPAPGELCHAGRLQFSTQSGMLFPLKFGGV
jgi:hypothetical protein